MVTVMTFVFAGFAILGGILGARVTKAPLSSAAISVAVGFAMIGLIESLGWRDELLLTLIFAAVSVAVALAMRLTFRQVVGVVLGAFIASVIGHFIIAFVTRFYSGFSEGIAGQV